MRRALCWLTKAFLSVLSLKKRTVQPIFVLENMNLFVHGCRGQTWQNTLIQMCHSESLLSSPADDIWNETRLSQSVLYWIHQSHTARWQLCLSLKGPGLDDRVVTHGCSICLHCAIYLDCFLPLFILFFFPLTVFVLCVTRTYKVFTWWLWCWMTILQRFLQRGLGKKEEKRDMFNYLPIVSLIQWQLAVSSKSQLPQWRRVCSGFCHPATWVIFLYQRPKACLEQLPPFVPSE